MKLLERFAAMPLALFLLLAIECRAEGTPEPAANNAADKVVNAVPLNGETLQLDGSLDENVWRRAQPIEDFAQKEPNEFGAPNEHTEVRVAYDEDALWIGATMFCDNPQEMLATVSRRDNAGNSQRIIISLDTYGDKRTAYSFGVTATGVRIDYYHPTDAEYNRDYSFDPVWEARTQILTDRWTAEMRIPFSQLRYNQSENELPFGLNINRWIPGRNEDVYWVVIPRNATGWSSRMGRVLGLSGVESARGVELLPYVAGDWERLTDPNGGAETQTNFRAGGDLKMGLGANFTLDATFNPDFGQVEADPAEVNLSAFETFFDERRPFFIEGSQLLAANVGPSYFYSRRVGETPRVGAVPPGEAPKNTTILSAAKVTGRTQGGMSLGVLGALTSEETGEVDNGRGGMVDLALAPQSSFGVARVQQEFGDEDVSTIGAMATAVLRDTDAGDDVARTYSEQAFSGGLDWELWTGEGEYRIRGHLGGSSVSGSKEYITQLQRSSARFYQRPDADYVEVDSSLTSLEGFTASLRIERLEGKHWLGGASIWTESPGFEINDAGAISSVDGINGRTWLNYRENEPGPLLRKYGMQLTYEQDWNYGGDRLGSSIEFAFNTTFHNFYDFFAAVQYNPEAFNDDLSRGGPLVREKAVWDIEGSLNSNFALNTRFSIGGEYNVQSGDPYRLTIFGSVSYRGAGRLDLAFEPWIRREINEFQYVKQQPGGREATYGTRYIFGKINRSTLALPVRINYSFTPDLSVELYAEPFAASGSYERFGELEKAGGTEQLIYGEDIGTVDPLFDGVGTAYIVDGDQVVLPAPDFLFTSFRSNLVVRWEWLPGSTLFFVWQQNGEDFAFASERAGFLDAAESITNRSDSFIGLKLSYWLPVRW